MYSLTIRVYMYLESALTMLFVTFQKIVYIHIPEDTVCNSSYQHQEYVRLRHHLQQ